MSPNIEQCPSCPIQHAVDSDGKQKIVSGGQLTSMRLSTVWVVHNPDCLRADSGRCAAKQAYEGEKTPPSSAPDA